MKNFLVFFLLNKCHGWSRKPPIIACSSSLNWASDWRAFEVLVRVTHGTPLAFFIPGSFTVYPIYRQNSSCSNYRCCVWQKRHWKTVLDIGMDASTIQIPWDPSWPLRLKILLALLVKVSVKIKVKWYTEWVLGEEAGSVSGKRGLISLTGLLSWKEESAHLTSVEWTSCLTSTTLESGRHTAKAFHLLFMHCSSTKFNALNFGKSKRRAFRQVQMSVSANASILHAYYFFPWVVLLSVKR